MLSLWCLVLVSCLGLNEGQVSRSYLPAPMPIITKQFYSISPAEEPEELQPRTKHLVIGQPRRNYRIIFIRAPSASSEQLNAAPQRQSTPTGTDSSDNGGGDGGYHYQRPQTLPLSLSMLVAPVNR
ncbi:Hypothetical predicted protein [Drosophila guanche]|uniref:DUF243 domain-containing protein n=1 Tax=Drosophila guanche TaxID=7266 RepID=A0A3B0KVN7_DROGU|nr:Hypothetical predicted protein [Drosophila guanche]